MYASILKSWVRKRERRANCCGFSVLRGIVSQTLLLQRWTSLFSRLLGERGRSQGGPPSSEVSLNGGRGEQRRRKKGSSIKIPFTFLFTFSFFHFLSLSLAVYLLIIHFISWLPVEDSLCRVFPTLSVVFRWLALTMWMILGWHTHPRTATHTEPTLSSVTCLSLFCISAVIML